MAWRRTGDKPLSEPMMTYAGDVYIYIYIYIYIYASFGFSELKDIFFIPLRFSPEEKARRDPYDHIPFGYGPRNCIAMRFALMEIIVSAALVLKHFTIVSHEKSKVSQHTYHQGGYMYAWYVFEWWY